jgi:dual specificity MAP kinase phosphatase
VQLLSTTFWSTSRNFLDLAQSFFPTESIASLGFGFPEPAGNIQAPADNQKSSIFERVNPNNVPVNFTFGAEKTGGVIPQGSNNNGAINPTWTDNLMDSS